MWPEKCNLWNVVYPSSSSPKEQEQDGADKERGREREGGKEEGKGEVELVEEEGFRRRSLSM